MAELRYKIIGKSVQPMQERAFCHCGEELKAKDGSRSIGDWVWRHMCKNGHFVQMPEGVKYPRIVYVPTKDITIETEQEYFRTDG